MTPIKARDTITKKIIRTALGDKDLDDEEMLERAHVSGGGHVDHLRGR
jgi:hypothetical protein